MLEQLRKIRRDIRERDHDSCVWCGVLRLARGRDYLKVHLDRGKCPVFHELAKRGMLGDWNALHRGEAHERDHWQLDSDLAQDVRPAKPVYRPRRSRTNGKAQKGKAKAKQ
ncbi:hypothetical protein AURDEDRAFT_116900 [Auricularia subglabra TFB-10046 SS5]|uniref:Uncharacterized protein n=1 Tax=Auricularia subglabra (strain TFB-10046 / SS5) TaxID=717982 RepID=J0WU42_AURST|nr:hypothetical protein AURDEDRAFT_116900 [Auricularia subglabra TFB-10046 SS5]